MNPYAWGALALVLLAGCQLPMAAQMNNPNDAKASNYNPKAADKDLTSFSFVPGTGNNPGSTVAGVISGTDIAVQLPEGTAKNNLIATFTTTGSKVVVNNIVQVSGTTANDYTNALAYTVTAQDGTTKIYNVTVTVPTSIVAVYTTSAAGLLSGYVFNTSTGAFSSISMSPLNAPFTGTITQGVDPLGRFINYFDASVAPTHVHTYAINKTSGALTEPATYLGYNGGVLGTTYDQAGKFLFILDSPSVTTYPISSAGTLGSPVTSTHSVSTATQLLISPNGKWAYIASNIAAGGVSSFTINTTGSLSSTGTGYLSTQWATMGPSVMAIDPKGQYLVASNNQGKIVAFVINQTTGTLSGPTELSLGGAPTNIKKLVFAPSGKAFYLIEPNSSYNLYTGSFSNGVMGELALKTLSMPAYPTDLKVDKAGTGLYAVGPNAVVPLTISSGDGSLTANTSVTTTIAYSALDPLGKYFLLQGNGGAGDQIRSYQITNGSLATTGVQQSVGAVNSFVVAKIPQ